VAVYTLFQDSDFESIIQHYPLETIGHFGRASAITEGIDNSNYHLFTSTGHWILTIFESLIPPKDIPFFLEIMEYLRHHDIPCPFPLKNKLNQNHTGYKNKIISIVSFLPGLNFTVPAPSWALESLAFYVAAWHKITSSYPNPKPNPLGLTRWRELLDACHVPMLEQANDWQVASIHMLYEELDWLAMHWPQALPRGIIHADLFPDNVFFDVKQEQLSGIIDFYFSCEDMIIYDLAIILNAWCKTEQAGWCEARATHFLNCYQMHRPLSHEEKIALPMMLRAASMRFLTTRLYDWFHPKPGAIVIAKDPKEYWHLLQFHQQHSNQHHNWMNHL
jgi:homoserine kinase type II